MRQGISSTNDDAHFCFRALFILIFLVTSTQCQRRGFSHNRRHHHHHRPPPLPPIFPPHQQQPSSFWQHQHYTRNHVLQQEAAIITNSNCPFVHVNRVIADEGWYGMLSLESQSLATNVTIEIHFDDFVAAFVNDFGHSTTADNKIFTIVDAMKVIKKFESLDINFFVKFNNPTQPPPTITMLKLNDKQVCPEKVVADDDERGCARFEMLTDGGGGRWDARLTIYTRQLRSNMNIDLEFDGSSWALGNDFGNSITSDQRTYTIISDHHRQFNTHKPLIINLFLKYNELDDIPLLKDIKINGHHVCLPDDSHDKEDTKSYSMMPPAFNRSMDDMFLLTDMPLDLFPNVALSPSQVNNTNYQCGGSRNALKSRINGGNITAAPAEFPFHVAIFFESRYRCGGSLLSQTATITAAHCVVNSSQNLLPLENFRLLFGSVDLKSLTGNEALRKVKDILKHGDYEYDRILKFDIAIVRMEGNLQFSPFIQPICLPNSQLPSINTQVNKHFIILGFGSSAETLQISRYLHYGFMTVISRTKCTEKIIFALLPEQSTFCALAKDNVLACPGDSGGGAVEAINGSYYLRGIASVTLTEVNGRCNAENPVGFTNVDSFVDWIKERI